MYNSPFSNLFEGIQGVGSRIKLIAKILFWVGVACLVCSLLVALVSQEAPATKIGELLSALLGCLVMCVGAFLIYGFGVLVENSEIALQRVGKLDTTINNVAKETNKKLDEIDEKIAKINERVNSEEEKRG
jgi:uncharacterized membrane protein YtjA (UPF0391 family)